MTDDSPKPTKRRPWQFSLRRIFLAVTVIALWCGWFRWVDDIWFVTFGTVISLWLIATAAGIVYGRRLVRNRGAGSAAVGGALRGALYGALTLMASFFLVGVSTRLLGSRNDPDALELAVWSMVCGALGAAAGFVLGSVWAMASWLFRSIRNTYRTRTGTDDHDRPQ